MKKLLIFLAFALAWITGYSQDNLTRDNVTVNNELTVRDTTIIELIETHGGGGGGGVLNINDDVLDWDTGDELYKPYDSRSLGGDSSFYYGTDAPQGAAKLNWNGKFGAASIDTDTLYVKDDTITGSTSLQDAVEDIDFNHLRTDSLLSTGDLIIDATDFSWDGDLLTLKPSQSTNLSIGNGAGTGGQNITNLGYVAGIASTANGGTFVGSGAGSANTTGIYNTAIGAEIFRANTTGQGNTAVGRRAMYLSASGNFNLALGRESLYSNLTGGSNVALGYQAGYLSTGTGNIFIGTQAGYNETGTGFLYIDNSNTTTPLIHGNFSTDVLTINGTLTGDNFTPTSLTADKLETDTIIIDNDTITTTYTVNEAVSGSEIDSITVTKLMVDYLIRDRYEAAAYTHPDSTITTSLTTSWEFLGAGENNKFTNINTDGFSFDGDTLMFDQDAADLRDSIEFHISYSCESATSSVNKTVYIGIFVKSVGGEYVEQLQCTRRARTSSSGVFYVGPILSVMPIYLKDGDKIQIRAKCAATTTTLSTESFGIYLFEE